MINSRSKFELVKHSLKISSPKEKKEYIIKELDKLSEHQSNWFSRKFSPEIPHSLQIVICDLTDAQNPNKINRITDYNNTLKDVYREFLKTHKDDFLIKNILNQAEKNDLINKNKGITNSNYTQYLEIKRYGRYCTVIPKSVEKKNGKCTITYLNGDIYKGEFKENGTLIIPYGQGKLSCKEGYYTYKGEFKDGWADGEGVVECRSRSLLENYIERTYTGEFKEGWITGSGKIECWWWGLTYEGEFNDDMLPDGKGKVTFDNGTICNGEFTKGILNENSDHTIRYPAGEIYTSTWNTNTKQCSKSMKYLDGSIYKGDFNEGNIFYNKPWPHGNGTLKYSSGSIYEGTFKYGKPYNGTLKYSNGSIYHGTFKYGKPYNGTLKYSNGSIYHGTFKDSNPYNGTFHYYNDKFKIVQTKITNGKSPTFERSIRGQFITEQEIEKKISNFEDWFNTIKSNQVSSLTYTIANSKYKLRLEGDIISYDHFNKFEFKNIIIVKYDKIFRIQDADTHLKYFKTNPRLPLDNKTRPIKGVTYWLNDDLIDFIILTNWSSETCKLSKENVKITV